MIFLILFTTLRVNAQEEYIGISLDCHEGCENQEVDYSKDIMLILTISNKLDYWVAIGDEKYGIVIFSIYVENSGLKDGKGYESYQELISDVILLKPKSEEKIYLPFDVYNQIKEDDRLGEWKISPSISFGYSNNIKFYEDNPFEHEEKDAFQIKAEISSPIKGNILKFDSVKPKVSVPKESLTIPPGFWDDPTTKNLIIPIIVVVIGGIILWWITKKK